MKTLPITANEEEVRQFIRQWVALLAKENYAEAVDMLVPEIPPASGSIDNRQESEWTPELLEAVINNYGTPEPWDKQINGFKVVPVDQSLKEEFDEHLTVETPEELQWLPHRFGIHVDLPLNQDWDGAESGNHIPWVSDLTARLYSIAVNDEIGFVLMDIHVL